MLWRCLLCLFPQIRVRAHSVDRTDVWLKKDLACDIGVATWVDDSTVVIGVLVMCLYAWLAHLVRPLFNTSEWVTLQDRIFGGLVVIAAIVMAVIDSGGEDL